MRTLRETLMAAVEALDVVQQDDHIKVWRYKDAPPALQGLSQAGGDEDWLALVPDSMDHCYFPWLVGRYVKVNRYLVAGAVVYIGCHA